MHMKEVIQVMKRQFPWLLPGHVQEASSAEEGLADLAVLPLVSAGMLESFYYTDTNPFYSMQI